MGTETRQDGGSLLSALDRIAFWWLRKRHPKGITVMPTAGEQWVLANYEKLTGTERS